MSQYQWKKLNEYTRKRAGERCEICSSDRRPEAHERWSFDIDTRVQKLERLMCLCKACHLGTHWGLTSHLGLTEEIETHIRKVTGWSKQEFSSHLKDRSASIATGASWVLDLTIVNSIGIVLVDPVPVIAGKKKALNAEIESGSLEVDGEFFDLRREIREGYVAIHASSKALMLGSIPLLNTMPCYVAKSLQDLGPDVTVRLSLASFVKACKNVIVVSNSQSLHEQIALRGAPRRLVPAAGYKWDIPDDSSVGTCLINGIVF